MTQKSIISDTRKTGKFYRPEEIFMYHITYSIVIKSVYSF
jgi:hypothetical protein